MTLKKNGAAEIIEEKDLTSEKLIETVEYLIENNSKLEAMSSAASKNSIIDANERIYKVVMQLFTNAWQKLSICIVWIVKTFLLMRGALIV